MKNKVKYPVLGTDRFVEDWEHRLVYGDYCEIICYLPTTDNWYPPYYDNQGRRVVKVLLFSSRNDAYKVIFVAVWGNDDFSMSLECETEKEALMNFAQVITMGNVTMAKLEKLGFVAA